MTKASFTLQNGTVVQLEGTTEDIKKLLDFYSDKLPNQANQGNKKISQKDHHRKKEKKITESLDVDLARIVNLTKDCDDTDRIETKILDRSSQVDRTLLPLYIVHEYLEDSFGLTSGEISKVTKDLGIPISQPNVSLTLSGTASRYVIGDKVKKRGP